MNWYFIMQKFNIFSQLNRELTEFFEGSVHIAGNKSQSSSVRFGQKDNTGYKFNQNDTLDVIDLYYNSKFKTGDKDAEGQTKVFLNETRFRTDVAAKQVDIDVKDFVFVPGEDASVWSSYFANKEFSKWAKDNFFGELINEVVEDYPKYGTAVTKEVSNKIERVPIRTIRNPHNCKSLNTSRFVILEHKDMPFHEIEDMKGWDSDKLDVKFDDLTDVYERYGRVPLDWYKEQKGLEVLEGDDKKTVDTMSILVKDKSKAKKVDKETGIILFIEKITKRPFNEVHWKKIDGRWLGLGEVENQFENQVMRNLIANMRKRGLLWATKKIFQSTDSNMVNNLVRDVKDGQVLKIMPNGNITEVNTGTQSLAEFTAAEQEWEKNSDQKAFTFEVATGETLKSGTPFRLGVLLSNAVNSHFGKKRENLGLFFKRMVSERLFDAFKKENSKKHTISLFASEEGFNNLKTMVGKINKRKQIVESYLNSRIPVLQDIDNAIELALGEKDKLFPEIPDNYYDAMKNDVELVITGESVNLDKKIESLTNLYNTLAQQQDPRASVILDKIMALVGENTDALAGVKPQVTQQSASSQIASAFQGASGGGAGLETANQPSTL